MSAKQLDETENGMGRAPASGLRGNGNSENGSHDATVGEGGVRVFRVSIRSCMALILVAAVCLFLNNLWLRHLRLERKLEFYRGVARICYFESHALRSRSDYYLMIARRNVSNFYELRSEPDRILPVALTTQDGVRAMEAMAEAERADRDLAYYAKMIATLREAQLRFWLPEPMTARRPAEPRVFSQLRE